MAYLQYCKGDIFDSNAQVIVNTVNCKGVMGKGLALAFKQRYPDMFAVYQQECKTGKLRIGRPTLYQKSTPWILNFPTKDNWKANSKIEYLEKGLEYFAANYKKAGIKSIAFPKLGAQNGKLSWDDVGPLMVKYLSKLDIDVYIYIAEGDKEYFADDEAEKAIWRHFNGLALSLDFLINEVQLSPREAKKVFERRVSTEFASLSDITMIDGLAKVSTKRIKEYMQSQRYPTAKLPGMAYGETATRRKAKKREPTNTSRSKRKNTQAQAEHIQASSLFSSHGVVL